MTKFLNSFFLFIILIVGSPLLYGHVFESGQFSSLLHQMTDNDTLYLIDIDNTLIESTTDLGSDQWKGYIYQKALKAGFNKNDSDSITERFWVFVQPFIQVRLVDREALPIIQKLQKEAVVLALTAREPQEYGITEKQLSSVGIDLSNVSFGNTYLSSLPFKGLFQNGVIYSGRNKKAATLAAFLDQMNFHPKNIVFIDEKWEQIHEVEKVLQNTNYTGIRFSGPDARINAFNPQIADLQWLYLPKNISNEDARALMNQALYQN